MHLRVCCVVVVKLSCNRPKHVCFCAQNEHVLQTLTRQFAGEDSQRDWHCAHHVGESHLQHRDGILRAALDFLLSTTSETEVEAVLELVAVLGSLGGVSAATRRDIGAGEEPCSLPSLILKGVVISRTCSPTS